jgi:hypothetical protein
MTTESLLTPHTLLINPSYSSQDTPSTLIHEHGALKSGERADWRSWRCAHLLIFLLKNYFYAHVRLIFDMPSENNTTTTQQLFFFVEYYLQYLYLYVLNFVSGILVSTIAVCWWGCSKPRL